jgi:polyisoprenoid-binding protein YceI
MKKIAMIIPLFLLLTSFAATETWKSDKSHAELGFRIVHLGISDISGTFNDFDVSINAARPDFSDAVVELSAEVASIDTRVEMRDKHLKSADFFDAEKFTTITFKSTGIKKVSKDVYKLTGNLTMHGVTKPVSMDLYYRGTIQHPMSKKATAGFRLTGKIKRSDFELGSKFPAPMLSDEVVINANGEFAQ